MAEAATASREWLVLVDLHQERNLRSVRVMALPAVDLGSTEPEVSCLEAGSVTIVAVQTQIGHCARQQHGFRRVVRHVTTQALALLCRCMGMVSIGLTMFPKPFGFSGNLQVSEFEQVCFEIRISENPNCPGIRKDADRAIEAVKAIDRNRMAARGNSPLR